MIKVKHMTNPNIETPLETVHAVYIGMDWADNPLPRRESEIDPH